jgi:hypothetical protein
MAKVSTTRRWWEASDLSGRGDSWRRLWRKIEFELPDQNFLFGGEFRCNG